MWMWWKCIDLAPGVLYRNGKHGSFGTYTIYHDGAEFQDQPNLFSVPEDKC